jgi:hypothetical protein
MMTPDELRELLSQPEQIGNKSFAIAKAISRLRHDDDTLSEGREMVIRALEHYEAFHALNGALDALAGQVGLFPYADPQKLNVAGQLAYEFHRPLDMGADDRDIVFHKEQGEVYRGLMDGQSYVLSAPTSFGKSLIIDALLASRKFSTIVVIVPTIALIDETRRRLSRFRDRYKVVTHPSQQPGERNVFVLTQERAIDRADIGDIDLLIIDEFYKLDIGDSDDGERAAILNHALYKLRKKSTQIYLLGPSIQGIPDGFGERFDCIFKKTDFNTVVSQITYVRKQPSREQAFLRLAGQLTEPTLVYCKSPAQANKLVSLLATSGLESHDDELERAADWVADAFHPAWSLRAALRKGVGIHHGRVPRGLAHLNVKLFNEGKLRFLVCTSSLIEGVNTVAKNVIVYEGKIAQSRLDFFTFQNIRGRSGRMFQHFIGRVFVLDPPPEYQLDIVDIPVFTQGEETPLGLLMQVDDEDLTERSRERLRGVIGQGELPLTLLRENAHIDPEKQLSVARIIRSQARRLHSLLSWRGVPEWEQLKATCELIYKEFIERPLNGIFSGAQLAFRLNEMRRANTVQEFILAILQRDTRVRTPDDAVEAAFLFERNWASFAFPRYLGALDLIQREVFRQLGMVAGDYSFYGFQVENLFLPPELPALEEYGIPVQVGLKLRDRLSLDQGLDRAIASLMTLNLTRAGLSPFEQSIVDDARTAM